MVQSRACRQGRAGRELYSSAPLARRRRAGRCRSRVGDPRGLRLLWSQSAKAGLGNPEKKAAASREKDATGLPELRVLHAQGVPRGQQQLPDVSGEI